MSTAMYGRVIRLATNKNVWESKIRVFSSNSFSSLSNQPNNKDSKFVDEVRASVSGLAPSTPSTSAYDRVNVVKTSTTLSSSTSDTRENRGDTGSYVAKQGVEKAMETGLEIGEMAKKTLDNVWDATYKVKEAVAGDDQKGTNNVMPTDQFVDDLRKRADGYDLKKK